MPWENRVPWEEAATGQMSHLRNAPFLDTSSHTFDDEDSPSYQWEEDASPRPVPQATPMPTHTRNAPQATPERLPPPPLQPELSEVMSAQGQLKVKAPHTESKMPPKPQAQPKSEPRFKVAGSRSQEHDDQHSARQSAEEFITAGSEHERLPISAPRSAKKLRAEQRSTTASNLVQQLRQVVPNSTESTAPAPTAVVGGKPLPDSGVKGAAAKGDSVPHGAVIRCNVPLPARRGGPFGFFSHGYSAPMSLVGVCPPSEGPAVPWVQSPLPDCPPLPMPLMIPWSQL